jgi:hypothetical protein
MAAEQIGQAAGFSKENWPPGWCGLALMVQKFINDGCPGEIVATAAIGVLKRKRDGPPESFRYFENPIATAFAQFKRPLPEGRAPDGAINGHRKRTVIDAADDLIAKLNAIEGGPEIGQAEIGGGASAPAIRLLPQGRRE